MGSSRFILAVVLAPSIAYGLGCVETLALPRYPALMRAARLSSDINCSSSIATDGSEPRFRCTATDWRFASVARRVEETAKVAGECRLTGGQFRLRFLITPDVKQDVESYVIDKEGVVISISPMEVSGRLRDGRKDGGTI